MIKNENYITIQGWMINELKLSANELLIYAIIYGFSQDGTSTFEGSETYLAEMISVSRQTICGILSKLEEKNLVEKISNGKIYKYKTTCQKTLHNVSKNLTGDVSKNLTDTYIYNNNIYNNNTLVNLTQIDDNVLQKWNDLAKKYSLAEIRSLTPDRKKKFLARLKDQKMTEEQFFNEISIALEDSPFLRGKKWHEIPGHLTDSYWEDSDWRADFDFFLQPSSLQKAIEGKYADPTMRKMRMRNQQKQ